MYVMSRTRSGSGRWGESRAGRDSEADQEPDQIRTRFGTCLLGAGGINEDHHEGDLDPARARWPPGCSRS
jgi:hypothetical protein